MHRYLHLGILLLPLVVLSGCSVGGGGGVFGAHSPGQGGGYTLQDKIVSSGNGRYSQRIDSMPANPPDVSRIPDAEPVPVEKSRRGNSSTYTVFGRTYRVLGSSRGFTQTGTASWYGNKFHGHETSNGEVYDMFAMTAAHTSLPLPTFVRVTNLDNNHQVIVKVNDRGPFVGNRIIDLSYAAAHRLDMLDKGTARVRIEAIDPVQWQARNKRSSSHLARGGNNRVFLQVGAMANAQAAERLQSRARELTQAPVRVVSGQALYRVQVGPLEEASAEAAIRKLEASELGRPFRIRQ
jgi:rare lipoprotein A